MLYLLDANVLIDANRDYYPLDRVPEFWDWLVHVGKSGSVKMRISLRRSETALTTSPTGRRSQKLGQP